jgi:hypothetical protein
MSFRLFIYYCALCGGGGAFVGWGFGRVLARSEGVLAQGVKGLWLGVALAFALALVDALWNFSLRRPLAIAWRVLSAVPVGGLAGLLGGLLGEALYGRWHWGALLVLGWTLVGLLVGVSIGVFDLLVRLAEGTDQHGAVRKVVNGLLGGAAGGVVGGTLSLVLRGAWAALLAGKEPDQLWSPSATGFVALGACIGLMIGLAQVILKEAWLKVEAGFRAGRELILSKPVVTIGRAESCDVGLFGDPRVDKLHARIRRQGDSYLVEDADSAGGTFVNGERVGGPCRLRSGDAIRVGRCVLRFGER